MADAKQPPRSLTYKLGDLATVKAECERYLSHTQAPAGTFQNSGKAEVKQRPGTTNELEISFERTVTAHPRGAAEGAIAFRAMCKVSCIVVFDRDQGEALPDSLLNQLTAPIYFLAVERCRNLIASMGFPAPPVSAMPDLLGLSLETVQKVPLKTTKEKSSVIRKRRTIKE